MHCFITVYNSIFVAGRRAVAVREIDSLCADMKDAGACGGRRAAGGVRRAAGGVRAGARRPRENSKRASKWRISGCRYADRKAEAGGSEAVTQTETQTETERGRQVGGGDVEVCACVCVCAEGRVATQRSTAVTAVWCASEPPLYVMFR